MRSALWMGCVRSPYAPARITNIDPSAAQAMDGVAAVYTGADLAETWAAYLEARHCVRVARAKALTAARRLLEAEALDEGVRAIEEEDAKF